jgi:hypothetical protein
VLFVPVLLFQVFDDVLFEGLEEELHHPQLYVQ